jgi:hypothetical protein
MPIVRKIRLSDNMQTNLRDKSREFFVVYYSTCVIRFSCKSHIRNQYTITALNINIWLWKEYEWYNLYYCLYGIFPSLIWCILKGCPFLALYRQPSRVYKYSCWLRIWFALLRSKSVWRADPSYQVVVLSHLHNRSRFTSMRILWSCIPVNVK